MINIPVTSNDMSIGPDNLQGLSITNSWDVNVYKGPRPPKGTHRY